VVIKHPDGKVEKVPVHGAITVEDHPILVREDEFERSQHGCRDMTEVELLEWETARGCVGEWAESSKED
jgi:hypothetical protein